MSKLIIIIFCHLVGDYVLQQEFIAKAKSSSWYHLFVHCALYCVPFAVIYNIDYRLYILFISHFIIDMLKARYNLLNYLDVQFLHYTFAIALYIDIQFLHYIII